MESLRKAGSVRQRTLLNLGRHFDMSRARWAALAKYIEQLVGGQHDLVSVGLDSHWEGVVRRYAVQAIHARARLAEVIDYHSINVDNLELLHRTVFPSSRT